MFFSKIRGRLGWNNYPNVLQFKYALRALLLQNKVESPPTANCTKVKDDHDPIPSIPDEQDRQVADMLVTSTAWRPDVLFYISGFIANKLCKTVKCPNCAAALFEPPEEIHQHCKTTSLLSCKRSGKLFIPSPSVVKVVTSTDNFARHQLHSWSSLEKRKTDKIFCDVLQATKSCTFEKLFEHSRQCHILDQDMRDDHISVLIRHIVNCYLKLFFYQFGKVYTERVIKENKASRRHALTKQILFYDE